MKCFKGEHAEVSTSRLLVSNTVGSTFVDANRSEQIQATTLSDTLSRRRSGRRRSKIPRYPGLPPWLLQLAENKNHTRGLAVQRDTALFLLRSTVRST